MISSFSTKRSNIVTGSMYSVLNLRPNANNEGLDNNTVLDSSNNSVAMNSVGTNEQGNFSPMNPNWSVYFDGSGDKVTSLSGATVANLGSGDFTIEFWLYYFQRISSTSSTVVIDTRSTTSATNGWLIQITSGRGLALTNNNTLVAQTADGMLSPNEWHHVAYVRKSGNLRCYIDGATRNNVPTYNTLLDSVSLSIGAKSFATSTALDFYGYLSNLRFVVGHALYSDAFTVPSIKNTNHPGTILSVFQSNTLIDVSPNNTVLTTGGTPAVSSFSPFNKELIFTKTPSGLYSDGSPFNLNRAAYFDGVGDYVAASYSADFSLEVIPAWTIDVWIHLNFDNLARKRIAGTMPSSLNSGWSLDLMGDRKLQFMFSQTQTFLDNTVIDLNKWYHVAVTRDGSVLKIYINGRLSSTFTVSNGTTNTNNLFIGSSSEPFSYLGYMSNLRINNTTVLYQYEFEPPTEQLKPVTGTVLLTFQNNTFVDNSLGSKQLFAFSNAKMTPAGPFTSFLSSDLIKTGSNHFNGNYLETDVNQLFNISTGDFTIESWIFLTSTSTNASNILLATEQGQTTGMFFGFNGSTNGNRLSVSFNNSGQLWVSTTTQSTLLNRWTHVAWTRTQGTNRLFVNGVAQTLTGTTTGTSFVDSTNISNVKLTIGTNIIGYISNLRLLVGSSAYYRDFSTQNLYSGKVNNTSLLLDFKNSKLQDISGCNNIRMKNALISSFSNSTDGSIQFNGTSSIVSTKYDTILQPVLNDSYTIECWVYPTNSTGNKFIIGTSSGSTTNWHIKIANGFYEFNIGSSSFRHTTAVSLNTWAHLALCLNRTPSNTFVCYLNGVRLGSSTVSGIGTTAINLTLGAKADETEFFQGYIGNVRLIKSIALYRGTRASVVL